MKKFIKLFCMILIATIIIFNISSGLIIAQAEPENQTVEGEATHFVTGQSYPSNVYMTGYDVRSDNIYFNFDLSTSSVVNAGQTATFEYFIEVYDDSGNKLGNQTSYDLPTSQIGADGSDTLSIKNNTITLNSPLTAAYRYIITIKKVTIN